MKYRIDKQMILESDNIFQKLYKYGRSHLRSQDSSNDEAREYSDKIRYDQSKNRDSYDPEFTKSYEDDHDHSNLLKIGAGVIGAGVIGAGAYSMGKRNNK
jgi:hypothetical protein